MGFYSLKKAAVVLGMAGVAVGTLTARPFETSGVVADTLSKNFLFVRGGLIGNYHIAEVPVFAPAVECGILPSHLRWGLGLTIGYEREISPTMSFALGAMYSDRSALFATPGSFPFRDTLTGQVIEATTSTEVETSLRYIELQPEIRLRLSPSLRMMTGLRIGLAFQHSFTQREFLLTPSTAAFNDNGRLVRARSLAEGDIEAMVTPALALSIGLEHKVPLSRNLDFTQQIQAGYAFTQVAARSAWNIADFRAELGLRWRLPTSAKEELPPPPDTLIKDRIPPPDIAERVPPPPTRPAIDFTVQQQGERLVKSTFTGVEQPFFAVFFANNSAEITPAFATQQPTLGTASPKANEAIRASVANAALLAKTMKGAIRLTPFATDDETNPAATAKLRADAVRRLLLRNGVEADRIAIAPENIVPAATFDSLRSEEFRKVAITFGEALPFAIVKKDTTLLVELDTRIAIAPPQEATVRFGDDEERFSAAELLAKKYTLSAQGDTVLPWAVSSGDTTLTGQIDLKGDALPLRQEADLSALDNTLFPILFEYNSPAITKEQEKKVVDLLQKLPLDTYTLEITGSSDALGTRQRNLQLAQERAETLASFVRKSFPQARVRLGQPIVVEGATPEDRILARAVTIRLVK